MIAGSSGDAFHITSPASDGSGNIHGSTHNGMILKRKCDDNVIRWFAFKLMSPCLYYIRGYEGYGGSAEGRW